MSNDLAAWLRNRLDEVEAVAKAAERDAASPWSTDENIDSEQRDLVIASSPLPGFTSQVYELWSGEGADGVYGSPRVAAHVAMHDPASVLRQVAGARKLLELLLQELEYGYSWDSPAIKLLAEMWGWTE